MSGAWLAAFSLPDWIAMGWFLTCWVGYGWVVEHGPLGSTRGLLGASHGFRLEWGRQMLRRDNRISDVALIGNLTQNVSFYANTTIYVIAGLLALLGTMPSDPCFKSVCSAPQECNLFGGPEPGGAAMHKENGNCLALIAHWHVDHCANTDTQRAIEIVQRALVGQGVPNYQRVAIDEWLVQAPKLVKPVSTGDAHHTRCGPVCFNVDRLNVMVDGSKPGSVRGEGPTNDGRGARRHLLCAATAADYLTDLNKSGLEFS